MCIVMKFPTSIGQMKWILTELSGRELKDGEEKDIEYLYEFEREIFRMFESILIDCIDNPKIKLARSLNEEKSKSLLQLAEAIQNALK